MPTEHAQTTNNGEVVAGWKPPLLWFGSFRRSSTGRRGESGALQQTDLRVDTRTPRTVDSATPAQMDIYFTLFSLFFFTKPGNPLFEISLDPSKCHFPVAHEHFYAQSVFSLNRRVFWPRLSLSAIHRVYSWKHTECKNRVNDTCSYLWVRAHPQRAQVSAAGRQCSVLWGELITTFVTSQRPVLFDVIVFKMNMHFICVSVLEPDFIA